MTTADICREYRIKEEDVRAALPRKIPDMPE